MRIAALRKNIVDQLSGYYGKEEALVFFYLLAESYLEMKRVQVAVSLEMEIADQKAQLFYDAKERLLNHEPIQYILGETEFYGLKFAVNPHVLIPRQETEELVDWILKDIKKAKDKKEFKILDIGTGSGCIAISLAKNNPNARVYALDVSAEALVVAKENARENAVDIHFMRRDILHLSDLEEQFDIIVSNPPYVREQEKKEIMPNVLDNEPHLALFVKDTEPLVFYKKIAALAKQNLSPNGLLYFEINQYLGSETMKMMEEIGYSSLQLKKDLNGNHRMIKAKPVY